MKIKDVIHLYLGCKVVGTYSDNSGSVGYLTGITNGGEECEIQFILEDGINVEEEPTWNEVKEVKLILRPLSSMTEEEIMKTKWPLTFSKWGPYAPDQFIYLLSKGFDLFNLIPEGLALDATKL